MRELATVYAALGVAAVLLALVSRRLRDLPVSEPLVAMLLGIALGPQLAGVVALDDDTRDLLLLEGARFLLAWSVMSAALRFGLSDLRPLMTAVGVLLLVVMPLMAVAAGAAALLLGLPLALAAVVGACLCPTDPVLAASVVSGEPAERDLPSRLRQLLTVESGANDGLALPLVGLALAAALPATGPGSAAPRLAWEVLGGAAIGLVAGAGAGLAVRRVSAAGLLESGPNLVFTLLLAATVLGLARLADTGGVLAAFVAGLAYNRYVDQDERGTQDAVDEAVNRYAVLPMLLLLGAVLPWSEWAAFGPAAAAFVAAVLLLRRLPFVVTLGPVVGLRPRDAVFSGWFGPIGVSAVFYLAHTADKGVTDPRVFAAGTLAVAASVVAFGITGSPGRQVYARAAG